MSTAKRVLAPAARAACKAIRPMVPLPKTATESPGRTFPRSAAQSPTANGSIMAPSS